MRISREQIKNEIDSIIISLSSENYSHNKSEKNKFALLCYLFNQATVFEKTGTDNERVMLYYIIMAINEKRIGNNNSVISNYYEPFENLFSTYSNHYDEARKSFIISAFFLTIFTLLVMSTEPFIDEPGILAKTVLIGLTAGSALLLFVSLLIFSVGLVENGWSGLNPLAKSLKIALLKDLKKIFENYSNNENFSPSSENQPSIRIATPCQITRLILSSFSTSFCSIILIAVLNYKEKIISTEKTPVYILFVGLSFLCLGVSAAFAIFDLAKILGMINAKIKHHARKIPYEERLKSDFIPPLLHLNCGPAPFSLSMVKLLGHESAINHFLKLLKNGCKKEDPSGETIPLMSFNSNL